MYEVDMFEIGRRWTFQPRALQQQLTLEL